MAEIKAPKPQKKVKKLGKNSKGLIFGVLELPKDILVALTLENWRQLYDEYMVTKTQAPKGYIEFVWNPAFVKQFIEKLVRLGKKSRSK